MKRERSPQQQAVYDWFKNGTGNGLFEAVAGAGKTSTLIDLFEIVQANGEKCAYIVFNRKNADEAIEKVGFVPGIFINTRHGFGWKAWRTANPNCKLDAKEKWIRIATHLGLLTIEKDEKTGKDVQVYSNIAETVKELISLAKQRAFGICEKFSDKESWMKLVDHYSLEQNFAVDGKLPQNIDELILMSIRAAAAGLKYSVKIANEIIDFDDQVYMCLVGKVRMFKYDVIFLDECQDTNPVGRELAQYMLKPNGRLVAVGDRHQAIYGFTGADNDSMDLIAKKFNTTSLPLTVSFRCPKAVVRVAQRYVKHIESAPNAPEGIARKITLDQFKREQLKATDAILCRNVSPLVEMAYSLLKKGIPCHIEGKDIGASMIKLTTMWTSVKTVGAFLNKLEDYKNKQVSKLIAANKEMQAESLQDRCEALAVIAEDMPKDAKLPMLQNKIAVLFVNSEDNKVRETLTLSTIHKSKGREWDRVFWLGANKYQPSKFATQQWQMDQENNLFYVAATRARVELVEIHVPKKSDADILGYLPNSFPNVDSDQCVYG